MTGLVPLFALQLAFPLLLVGLIAVAPARSLAGFLAQAIATAAALFAIGLGGVWLFPPWWTPYALAFLLVPALIVGRRRRRRFVSVFPLRFRGWSGVALWLVLGALAALQAGFALAGRVPPQGGLVELAFPLRGGTYLIVNGGSDAAVNAHLQTLDAEVSRLRAWRGQSYGVDIVRIDRLGLRADGVQPEQPSAYRIHGSEVFAPCAGEVVAAVDHLPDLRVPEADRVNLAGNHVTLRCGGIDVVLAHLLPDSVKVARGARVRVGDLLARVGNSGNSDEPHLHIHAQRPGTNEEPMSGDPMPMRFGDRFLVRNDRVSLP